MEGGLNPYSQSAQDLTAGFGTDSPDVVDPLSVPDSVITITPEISYENYHYIRQLANVHFYSSINATAAEAATAEALRRKRCARWMLKLYGGAVAFWLAVELFGMYADAQKTKDDGSGSPM